MLRPEVANAIEEIVARDMQRMGYRSLAVEEGENYAGEPVLFIHVDYEAKGNAVDPEVVAGLMHKVRARLLDLGEERFPHIRHRFHAKQKILGHAGAMI